jgi:hypothetical protein
MAFGPFLASPSFAPGRLASRALFNRLAKCLIVAGLVLAGARLSASSAMMERLTSTQAQAVPAQGGGARPARAAPGLRHMKPEKRLAADGSAVSWSGAL